MHHLIQQRYVSTTISIALPANPDLVSVDWGLGKLRRPKPKGNKIPGILHFALRQYGRVYSKPVSRIGNTQFCSYGLLLKLSSRHASSSVSSGRPFPNNHQSLGSACPTTSYSGRGRILATLSHSICCFCSPVFGRSSPHTLFLGGEWGVISNRSQYERQFQYVFGLCKPVHSVYG